MKRTSSHPQSLKHLPFFQVLASAPEDSSEARLATAGLLSLRMIDHWVLAGPAIVEPESVSVRSVRQAIMALPSNEPIREALLTVVNTMQMLRHVDLVPVLPRVFAYAQLLERHHGSLELAADAYESVIRLADAEYDSELVMDCLIRLAFCQRKAGALDASVESSKTLAKLAGRKKDRARALRAKMGLALVSMSRGDLADADSQLASIAADAEHHELTREFATALHNRAVVAARGGNATDAILLAHEALGHTTDPVERDRILGDLAAFLIWVGDYEAALDALRIIEVTAVSEEPRLMARGNTVVVAARTGNRALFDDSRRNLDAGLLPIDARINYYIECARGFRAFGETDASDAQLFAAESLARTAKIEWAFEKIGEARGTAPAETPSAAARGSQTRQVAAALKTMAAALVAAG